MSGLVADPMWPVCDSPAGHGRSANRVQPEGVTLALEIRLGEGGQYFHLVSLVLLGHYWRTVIVLG